MCIDKSAQLEKKDSFVATYRIPVITSEKVCCSSKHYNCGDNSTRKYCSEAETCVVNTGFLNEKTTTQF